MYRGVYRPRSRQRTPQRMWRRGSPASPEHRRSITAYARGLDVSPIGAAGQSAGLAHLNTSWGPAAFAARAGVKPAPTTACPAVFVERSVRDRLATMPVRTLLSFLLLSLLYQNLNSLTPDERAKLEEQNNYLRALLQNAQKLPFEANPISVHVPEKDGPMSLVSWIAGD